MRWAVAAVAAASMGGVANAQVVPEGVGVADRARPLFEPVGGRVGAFRLYPAVSASAVATDNVRATPDAEVADVYALLHADARLQSDLSRHRVELRVFADQTVHAKATSEDALEFGASADGVLDVSQATVVTASIRAERQAEDRTGYDAITNSRRPVRYGYVRAAIGITQDLSPLTLSGGVDIARFDFRDTFARDGTFLTQQYRNFDQFGANVLARYAFRPGFSVLARGSYDRRAFDLRADSPLQPGNFERNSHGGRIEGGVGFDLTSLLYGEIRAGYLVRRYDDPRLRDASGLAFGADLLWNVTPLTTLRFAADRRVDEASSTVISGNRTTVFTTTVDHELLRNLILNGSLRYAQISPLGPLDSSSEYAGRIGARYFVTRRLSFEGGYLFAKRTSPLPDRRFTENRLTGTARLTF